MVKKTPLQSIIAFFVAFSLSFVQSQSCYASNSTGIWDNETTKNVTAAVVGVGGGAALLWWLLRSNDSNASNPPSPTPPATNGVPVILSMSNYNLLYIAGNGSNGGTSVPGKIYVLNNSDQAATNGFTLTSSSPDVVVSSESTDPSYCSQTVAAHGTCYFKVSYTASPTVLVKRDIQQNQIGRITATLTVNSGANSSDLVTVNTLSVPNNYLINPIADDTNAHGIDATINTWNFATIQKNGVNFVYAATDVGVFKTNDNGATWLAVNGSNRELTSANANSIVYALYAIGSVLYAGTDSYGVFSSTDDGATWKQINSGLTGNALIINAFASIGGKLYAGTNAGVFALDPSNPGAGWMQVGSNPDTVNTLCAVNKILCAGFYNDGVYYYDTTNTAADWNLVGSSSPNQAAILYSDGNYLYEGDYSQYGVSRIHISSITDGIAAWKKFGTGLESMNIYALYFINRNLYAGTNGSGVYKIDPAADPTTAWTQTISGFRNQYPAINALYSTPSVASPLYAGLAALGGAEQLEALEVADSGGEPNDGYSGGYGGGIYTTTPVASSGAETWILVSNTLTQHTVYTLFKTDSGTIYAGTYGDGVFSSKDGGANWTPITNNGLTNPYIYAIASFGNYLYAGVDNGGGTEFTDAMTHTVSREVSTTTPAVFRININSLNRWEPENNGLGDNVTAKTFDVDSNGLSVGIIDTSGGKTGGVYTFNTTSSAWQHLAHHNHVFHENGVNALASTTGSFWASSPSKGVFSNTNPPSTTWSHLDRKELTNKNTLSLQFNSNDNYLYVGCDASTSSSAFKISNTDGATWEDITGVLTGNPVNAYCLYNSQLYAGVTNNGVYAYGGTAATWNPIGSDITKIDVYALQAQDSNIYAAGTDVYAGTYSTGVLRATIAQQQNTVG